MYIDGLQTERLVTRFLTPDDAETWLEYTSDPVASRFIPNLHETDAETRAKNWIASIMTRYRDNRYGLQALIHKETGEFIGQCGLLKQDIGGREETEIGYHLLKKHWGKGYATEAARMFRNYAFENNLADTVISIIHPQNFPSRRVATRNGMTCNEFGVPFRGIPHDVFRINKDEWEKQRL